MYVSFQQEKAMRDFNFHRGVNDVNDVFTVQRGSSWTACFLKMGLTETSVTNN